MDDGTREIRPGRAATTQPYEEEFLFHLSRGSELLVENRVERAKEELERALRYQPHDEKGQDLLASVYFRLGLYPRAIEIWDRLARLHPADLALRVNLGLVLLKTGQPEDARAHFQRATEIDPHHARAYRYLGLAEWRCGQLDKARESFLRGGEVTMARRMEEMLGEGPDVPLPGPPSAETPLERFASEVPSTPPSEAPPPSRALSIRPASVEVGVLHRPETPASTPPLVTTPSGLLSIDTAIGISFRDERIRARVASAAPVPVPRRARSAEGMPEASAFVTLVGARLLVAPPEGLRHVVLSLEDDVLFVMEAHLEAWTAALAHEAARALDVDVVSLRGSGHVALRVRAEPARLRVGAGELVEVERGALVGWTGRIFPEGSASGDRLALRGEGTLLVL